MKDTTFSIEEHYNQLLMSRSGEERLKMGCSMHGTAKKMVRASLLNAAPHATENSIRQGLFIRFYANDFDSETQRKILQALATYSAT
jgi:hypothetical protein